MTRFVEAQGSIWIFSLRNFLSASSGARKLERIRDCGLPFFYTGDDVGASQPVGFCEVGFRPLRWVIGVGMVETDDIFSAIAALALNTD